MQVGMHVAQNFQYVSHQGASGYLFFRPSQATCLCEHAGDGRHDAAAMARHVRMACTRDACRSGMPRLVRNVGAVCNVADDMCGSEVIVYLPSGNIWVLGFRPSHIMKHRDGSHDVSAMPMACDALSIPPTPTSG